MVKNPAAIQETRVQSLGRENPMEKEMATHSGIPAWEIPWTEKHGRLQPWGRKESDTTEHAQQVLIEKDTSYHVLCRTYHEMPEDALFENVF